RLRRSSSNQAGTGCFTPGFDSAGLAGVSGLACFLCSSALCRALRASSARRWSYSRSYSRHIRASFLFGCAVHATPAAGERENARRPRTPSRRRRRRQMHGRRSKRWSVRRARLAWHMKKRPGERGFRTRESFAGRGEAEFPAFRALEMSEIAVAHFLRQRLVRGLPEWRGQSATHGEFLFEYEAPIRRERRTKSTRPERRASNARVPASGPCGQRAPARTILWRSKRSWVS